MKLWPNNKEKEYPKEGEVYEFLDIDEPEKITAIKIIKGKYEGVVYNYGKTQIEEGNLPILRFDYFLHESGNFSFEDLQSDEEFSTLMGDIIISVFDNNIIKKEIHTDDEIGTNDSEEFNLQ